MVLSEAVALAVAGLGCGVASAWAVTHLLRAFLYEVQSTDLSTFVVCARTTGGGVAWRVTGRLGAGARRSGDRAEVD